MPSSAADFAMPYDRGAIVHFAPWEENASAHTQKFVIGAIDAEPRSQWASRSRSSWQLMVVVLAKRCDSSRTYCSSRSAAEWRLSLIDSASPGRKISSSCLASEISVGGSMPMRAEGLEGRVQLALAAVDEQDVGERASFLAAVVRKRRLTTSRIEAKSSTPSTVLDLEAAIARLERQAVDERHQRRDRVLAA